MSSRVGKTSERGKQWPSVPREPERYIVADTAIGCAGGVSNKLTADISSLPCSYLLAPPPGCTGWFGGARQIQPARGERSFLPRICKLNNKYADIREEAAFRLHAARATRGLVAPATEGTAIFIRRLSGSRGPTLYTHTCTIPCCTCTRSFTLKRGGSVCARMHATRCTISLSRRLDAPLATLSRFPASSAPQYTHSFFLQRDETTFPLFSTRFSLGLSHLSHPFNPLHLYPISCSPFLSFFLLIAVSFSLSFFSPCSFTNGSTRSIVEIFNLSSQPYFISFGFSSFSSTSCFPISFATVLVRVSLAASPADQHTPAHIQYVYTHTSREILSQCTSIGFLVLAAYTPATVAFLNPLDITPIAQKWKRGGESPGRGNQPLLKLFIPQRGSEGYRKRRKEISMPLEK